MKTSICYAILEEFSKTPNYPIKKCQNCGMYCHLYLDYYFIEEFLIPEFIWDF